MSPHGKPPVSDFSAASIILAVFTVIPTLFAAWITHVVVCFDQDNWGFLIGGALAFPVAIVHGVLYWFGYFH